jgi:hypothetical protein
MKAIFRLEMSGKTMTIATPSVIGLRNLIRQIYRQAAGALRETVCKLGSIKNLAKNHFYALINACALQSMAKVTFEALS